MADDPTSEVPAELDVTVIVISYNSEGRIGAAVTAHESALSHLQSEILVVDNDSKDGSVIEAEEAIVNGRVIANELNAGYGKAANQAINEARGEACLILNDDARLAPGAIDRLLQVLHSQEDIALVGPRIVDEEGNPMPSARMTFPGLDEEWERVLDIFRRRNRNIYYPTSERPTEVAWLVAACVLGRTEVFRRVGGFNPAFFLYSEDIDLARRLTEQGYRIVTVPDAICVHTGSVSTSTAFGRGKSIQRRAGSRDIYYRIWQPRLARTLIHLRRAIGLSNQPWRLRHHLPRVIWDGRSLHDLRQIEPLPSHGPGGRPNESMR